MFWTVHCPPGAADCPWVLLFGFYGAKPKHLAKYAAVLGEAGLCVAACAAPTAGGLRMQAVSIWSVLHNKGRCTSARVQLL